MISAESARKLLEEGRFAEAETVYQQLSRQPSQRAEAFYGLGFLALKRNKPLEAKNWFQRCVKADPQHLNAHYYLAEAAASEGNIKEAIRLHSHVLAMNPRHKGSLAWIATLSQRVTGSRSGPSVQHPRPPSTPETPPSTQSDRRLLGRPPRPPSRRESLVGVAKNVRRQTVPFAGSPAAAQSLTFRLDVANERGEYMETVFVGMTNFVIQGDVENGDWVEVKRVRDLANVKKLRNLSTDSDVEAFVW